MHFPDTGILPVKMDSSIISYRNLLLKNAEVGKKLCYHDNSLPTIRNLPFEEEDNFDSHPHANLIFFVRPGEFAMQTYKPF